jgi:hypothetical protein
MVFEKVRSTVSTNSTNFLRWYSELHSLEKKLFILITSYITVSILLNVGLLVLQINSVMSISWLFYLFVLILVAGICITVSKIFIFIQDSKYFFY